VAPGQGSLAPEIELDPARPRRSFRFAQNRRWILPESVRDQLADGLPPDLRPVPRIRALLADAPDSIAVSHNLAATETEYVVTRSGGGNQGWIWALSEQQRTSGALVGIGVISLDLMALPQRLGLTLAENLPNARRRGGTPPGEVMWTPSTGWRLPSSQTITVSGDLRIERLVYAGYSRSYPGSLDEWQMTTATFAHLRDAGLADQRLTIWTLDGTDQDNPDRDTGIGIEATGLSADLDLDRYRALVTPIIRSYFSIPWEKKAEIQLSGYTGAWLMDSQDVLGLLLTKPNPVPYERPSEDVGFWFLRAINAIPGIGDAYFANTGGNINGRQRLYTP
jgi:hypothetical protein